MKPAPKQQRPSVGVIPHREQRPPDRAGMVITRYTDDAIEIGDVLVRIYKIRGQRVYLYVEAPRSTSIMRGEDPRSKFSNQAVGQKNEETK